MGPTGSRKLHSGPSSDASASTLRSIWRLKPKNWAIFSSVCQHLLRYPQYTRLFWLGTKSQITILSAKPTTKQRSRSTSVSFGNVVSMIGVWWNFKNLVNLQLCYWQKHQWSIVSQRLPTSTTSIKRTTCTTSTLWPHKAGTSSTQKVSEMRPSMRFRSTIKIAKLTIQIRPTRNEALLKTWRKLCPTIRSLVCHASTLWVFSRETTALWRGQPKSHIITSLTRC